MATTNDLKNGLVLNLEGQLWAVVEFQHVKPGKGPAFVRTKLKSISSGKVVDKTFNAGTKVETANVLVHGRTVRLVDFEDGGLSDPAYELADHVEHLGSRLPGVYDVHALPAAVGLDEEALQRMAAYRPLFAAFWLAMLLPGNGAWRRNPPGTTEEQAEHFMRLVSGH